MLLQSGDLMSSCFWNSANKNKRRRKSFLPRKVFLVLSFFFSMKRGRKGCFGALKTLNWRLKICINLVSWQNASLRQVGWNFVVITESMNIKYEINERNYNRPSTVSQVMLLLIMKLKHWCRQRASYELYHPLHFRAVSQWPQDFQSTKSWN